MTKARDELSREGRRQLLEETSLTEKKKKDNDHHQTSQRDLNLFENRFLQTDAVSSFIHISST
jgi:hypothetical protein